MERPPASAGGRFALWQVFRGCESAGTILAQHAAVAMAGVAAENQSQAALASRDLIGQAKGILMHRENLTGLQAFNTLAQVSKGTSIKLVDVARWLVEEHENAVGQSEPAPTATK